MFGTKNGWMLSTIQCFEIITSIWSRLYLKIVCFYACALMSWPLIKLKEWCEQFADRKWNAALHSSFFLSLSFSTFALFNLLFSLSFLSFFLNIFFLLWCRRQTHRIYSHFIFQVLSFFIRFVGWKKIIDGILVGVSTSHHSNTVIPILRYISAEWASSSSLFVVCLFFSLTIFISIPLCIFLFPLLRLLFLSTPWKSIVIYDYMMCMSGRERQSVCLYHERRLNSLTLNKRQTYLYSVWSMVSLQNRP